MKNKQNFWKTVNANFSEKERQDFNNWKIELYLAADNIRDYIRTQTLDYPTEKANRREMYINKLIEQITKIPTLRK